MRVVISQELLAGTLSAVGKAVATRNINPVLNHVRIVTEPDLLTLTATDGDFTIRRTVAITGASPGARWRQPSCCPSWSTACRRRKSRWSSRGNQLNITVGRSNYNLTVMGDENFPELPDFTDHRLIALVLPHAQARAAADDVLRRQGKQHRRGALHQRRVLLASSTGGWTSWPPTATAWR